MPLQVVGARALRQLGGGHHVPEPRRQQAEVAVDEVDDIPFAGPREGGMALAEEALAARN